MSEIEYSIKQTLITSLATCIDKHACSYFVQANLLILVTSNNFITHAEVTKIFTA